MAGSVEFSEIKLFGGFDQVLEIKLDAEFHGRLEIKLSSESVEFSEV